MNAFARLENGLEYESSSWGIVVFLVLCMMFVVFYLIDALGNE